MPDRINRSQSVVIRGNERVICADLHNAIGLACRGQRRRGNRGTGNQSSDGCDDASAATVHETP